MGSGAYNNGLASHEFHPCGVWPGGEVVVGAVVLDFLSDPCLRGGMSGEVHDRMREGNRGCVVACEAVYEGVADDVLLGDGHVAGVVGLRDERSTHQSRYKILACGCVVRNTLALFFDHFMTYDLKSCTACPTCFQEFGIHEDFRRVSPPKMAMSMIPRRILEKELRY